MDTKTTAPVGDERPIACLLSEAEQAQRGEEIAEQLFAQVAETRELDDGYAFRLPGDGEWFERVTAFVAAERRCCPFFRFEIVVEPEAGSLWLSLRGRPGVKAFVASTFPVRWEAGEPAPASGAHSA